MSGYLTLDQAWSWPPRKSLQLCFTLSIVSPGKQRCFSDFRITKETAKEKKIEIQKALSAFSALLMLTCLARDGAELCQAALTHRCFLTGLQQPRQEVICVRGSCNHQCFSSRAFTFTTCYLIDLLLLELSHVLVNSQISERFNLWADGQNQILHKNNPRKEHS